jgi:hypothetical protein
VTYEGIATAMAEQWGTHFAAPRRTETR